MDRAVKAKILDRARAREIEKIEYPEPSLAQVRKRYGGPQLSDEELLLRYYAGPEFVDALKSAPKRDYAAIKKPIVKLIEELGSRKLRRVFIQKKDFSLVVRKGE
jgi:oxaloacetate decarboxylase (Na+ extruding) subunit alpha